VASKPLARDEGRRFAANLARMPIPTQSFPQTREFTLPQYQSRRVLLYAVEHDRDRPAWADKKVVAGKFGAAQLRRCQRPAHIRASSWHGDCQYSSANMMVMTRLVTAGSDGSGECTVSVES
jgi:hypothetical protein